MILISLVLGTPIFLMPQLLRAKQRNREFQHTQTIWALEAGQGLASPDSLAVAAGRTAGLVPMVSVCPAATVMRFLSVYHLESFF